MKGLRILKKSKQLYKSVESQSRQIITNIFANGIQSDKLQLDLKQWSNKKINPMIIPPRPSVKLMQPLKNLLQLLSHLSKDFYIDICSFIFLGKDDIHVVFKEKQIVIKKIKKQKSQLKYWFSHIYFSRLRNKLAESLLEQNFNAERDVIHYNEEKEYMPSHVSGGKKSPTIIIRQIKVSRSSIDRKRGDYQRQQFCVGYYNNGAEQLFNFSEVLSFVQYPFNVNEISYFKILTKQKQNTHLITTSYSIKERDNHEEQTIGKLKRLLKKQDRWALLKDEFQELKNLYIKKQQYELYCKLIMFQIISFLEVRVFVQVKELKLQWMIGVDSNIVLSNASIYRFEKNNRVLETNIGLITLYQKCQTNRYKTQTNQSEESEKISPRRFKKIKSEQKYVGEYTTKLPLLNLNKKPSQNSQAYNSRVKKKARSCVLRMKTNKLYTQ